MRQRTSAPPNIYGANPLWVSCASAALCVAVDSEGNAVATTNPTAANATWSVPANVDPGHIFQGVACPSTSLCVAVDYTGDALITTNPTAAKPTWSAPVKVDPNGGLTGISCAAKVLCAAVDNRGGVVTTTNPTAARPTWTKPKNVTADPFSSISCPSRSLCVAVDTGGHAVVSTNPTAVSPVWRAATNIDGSGQLNGVSCPSTSVCVAVDESGRMLLTTNPTAASPNWSPPARIDGVTTLSGVSCATTSLCVAVDAIGSALIGHGSGAFPPSSISPPTITGKPIEGEMLTERHGSWTSSPTRFSYHWEQCDNSGGRCSKISHATAHTYKLTRRDVEHTIRVQESAANATPGGAATSAPTAVVIPTAARIKASLRLEITPHGRAARIGVLRKNRGCVMSVKAVVAGRIAIDWYYLPRGVHLATARGKSKPALVAAGKAALSRARTLKITIRLTAYGERLLKHATRLTLTAQGTLSLARNHAVIATKKFTLRR